MRPSFPGLPDREQACRGSEPKARPSGRHLAALMETAVRLRTDSHGNSEDGGVGGRAPGPAPSPSPTPAAALLQVSPYLADLQLAGKGLWGMLGGGRGGGQPAHLTSHRHRWAWGRTERDAREVGLPGHPSSLAPDLPPPQIC